MSDTITYEFDAYAEGVEEWSTTPGEMVDGVETDYASTTTDGDIQKLTGNECAGTDLGAISKVELAAYAYADDNDQLILRPVFAGGDGDNHTTVPGVAAGWGEWQDIAEDTNGPGVVDQSLTCGGTGNDSVYGQNWLAQTFTPATNHTIGAVSFYGYKGGSPGTCTVGIRATDGDGRPTGNDLCSADFNGNDWNFSPDAWNRVVFATGASLLANTKYAIVLRAPDGDVSNRLWWRVCNLNHYAGGNEEHSSDGGSTWEEWADLDYNFKEGPFTWAWSDVQNLDCDVEQNDVGKGNTMYCGMVKIHISYTPSAPPAAVGFGIVV